MYGAEPLSGSQSLELCCSRFKTVGAVLTYNILQFLFHNPNKIGTGMLASTWSSSIGLMATYTAF